jgi:lysophospholipase L1-like esterase
MTRSGRRLIALRVTVATLSALCGLAVAEWAARATYGPGFLSVVDPYEHHPYRAYAELADTSGQKVFTNSLGWKDSRRHRKVERDPAPRRRVVFLGDSFTEGLGVPQEQTFSAHVEQRLNRGSNRFEVLNGGRVSYSPLLEYMRLKRFLAAGYRADTVVLLPDLSDVQDELEYTPEYEISASGEPLHLRSGNSAPVVRWIYNRSALTRWARRLQLRLQGRLPSVAETAHAERELTLQPADAALLKAPGSLTAEAYSRLSDPAKAILRHTWSDHLPSVEGWAGDGLRSMEKNILRIRKLTRLNGMELIVVIYPYPQTLYTHGDPAYYRILRQTFPKWFHQRELLFGTAPSNGAAVYRQALGELCRANSIPFVDLFPAFRRKDWHRLFLSGDVHFGLAGHRLAGREIADAILRERGETRP